MSELRAKKRYKVLCRERERVEAKGQSDAQLDEEIKKLLIEFPSLSGTKTEVSESTKAMLNFAETMDDSPQLQVPLAPVASQDSSNAAPPALQSTMQQQQNSPVNDQRDSKTAAVGTSRLENTLSMIAVALRVYNDLQARSTFGLFNQVKLSFLAVMCAISHCIFFDPCTGMGRCFDPIMFVVLVHAHSLLVGGISSSRGLLEAAIVYMFRDFLPSLTTTIVTYCVALLAMSVLDYSPMRMFCS